MATQIALVQTDSRELNQYQQNVRLALIPILKNPAVFGSVLASQPLIVGTNTINHGLSTALQGWIVIGINGISSIYDAQATNSSPDKTLILVSSAAVTVSLYVF